MYRVISGLEEDEFEQHQCRVLDRYEMVGKVVYMVELFVATENEDDMTDIEYYDEVLFAVPRDDVDTAYHEITTCILVFVLR